MSTVTKVPETRDLNGDDAVETLRSAQLPRLLGKSFVRFRYGDGFSFARSLAFQVVMTLIPGVIFTVALAAALGEGRLREILRTMIEALAPGPAGQIFLQAFQQGAEAGSQGDMIAVVAGGAAMLIAAVTATAQIQRGASRIYGIDADRPTLRRYGLATVLTLTAGAMLTVAFVLITLGGSIRGYFSDELAKMWVWFRWPVGLLALTLGLAGLMRFAPNRRQPRVTWLVTGGLVGAVGWVIVSVGLAFYLNASGTFGETYGPLAGVIGLALWAQLSAIAILYGVAVAAELEAERAGVAEPREDESAIANGAKSVRSGNVDPGVDMPLPASIDRSSQVPA